MQKIKSEIKSRQDGLGVFVLTVLPQMEQGMQCRGIVQILHGMSEYKERYLPFMEYLAEKGFVAVIHDHRGHGASVRSREDLGYMYGGGTEAFLDDILQVNEEMHKKFPKVPLILFGHSMGSLAARAFTRRYDDKIDALILSGSPSRNPARAVGTVIAKLQRQLFGKRHPSKLLEGLSFGSYAAKFKDEESIFSWVCSAPEVVEEYDKNPLCGFTFTTDAYLVLFELMKQAYAKKGWQCARPDMPILFVGGADDPCIGGPRKYADALMHMRLAGYRNVKGKLYPGMRHEILNEREKKKVFRDINAFLRKNGL
ncbi:MAG: alpha/beta fold hydrolase [Eubacteriales bacterium]|nr:alpha/beta fold hydrolase [Eubacteriales bacterium]